MIIQVTNIDAISAKRPKKLPWHQKFKRQIYLQNYRKIIEYQNKGHKNYDRVGKSLLLNIKNNQEKVKQDNNSDIIIEGDNTFCSYIPLKKNIQMEDELLNTFQYFRNLRDKNRNAQLDNFYSQMRKFIKKCKQEDKVELGWEICLMRFICNLDVIRRIQIYQQILMNGTRVLKKIHQMFNPRCLEDIFLQRIILASRYFKQEIKMNLSMGISVQLKDEINETTMSKTMKMLYCIICLTYDCGKHKADDICHQKEYRYISPKNCIQPSVHIVKSIDLYKDLKQIVEQMKNADESGCDSTSLKAQLCSQNCYRNLTMYKCKLLQALKPRIISPFIEGIIKIGIQMFSYQPCSIIKLFPSDKIHHQITCSLIFLYFLEEGNLYQLLNNRIASSQTQLLTKQITSEDFYGKIQKNGQYKSAKKKKRKRKIIRPQKQNAHQVSVCFHNYIGEEIFDSHCANCACNQRGFCLPSCQCSQSCVLMVQGCNCRSKDDCQTKKCPCYQNKTECIPQICLNCFQSCELQKKNGCSNNQILLKKTKLIRVGKSKINEAGLGGFAGEFIRKNSLVSIYCGEVIQQQMETIREIVKKDNSFYNFGCNEGSTDARFMGNKSRFINHANQDEGKANLMSLKMFSEGQEFIGLYSLRDIEEGEELYFDYDVQGQMGSKHGDIYPFLVKKSHHNQ